MATAANVPTTSSAVARLSTSKRGSVTREQDDCEEEWENHVLLRFPEEEGKLVDEILSEDQHIKDQLAINFAPGARYGSILIDKRKLYFKVYDLPCITEVMKTLDKKTFYKVADLSQIIVCSTKEFPVSEVIRARRWSNGSGSGGESSNSKKDFQWPHGLAPPMKNARRRRFRKAKKKKYMDAPDVERELKRLLRSDLEAHSIRWEVVPIEQKEKESLRSEPEASQQKEESMTQEKIAYLLDSLSDSGEEGD